MAWFASCRYRHAHRVDRRGVTLIELLVSVALTLIVILAIVRVFDLLGGNVSDSRSILELSAQLRMSANQLQTDLDRLTLTPDPPANPLNAPGYFEIIEGKRSDRDTDGDDLVDTDPTDTVPDLILLRSPVVDLSTVDPTVAMSPRLATELGGVIGDVDDVWMGTVRSPDEPFTGRFNGRIIQSPLAEVIWWVEPILGPGGVATGATELVVVRRLMLVLPSALLRQTLAAIPLNSPAELIQFLRDNDVSVRPEFVPNNNGSMVARIVPNTLADLTTRRNRFAHWTNNFMSAPAPSVTFPNLLNRRFLVRASDRSDLVLNDVLAMDVRVYDPLAPVYRPSTGSSYVVTPIDPGYQLVVKAINPQIPGSYPESFGAYVDLGFNVNQNGGLFFPIVSHFSGPPRLRSRTWVPSLANIPRVYCTWSTLYERDGIDQNRNGDTDEGTDGIDTPIINSPENPNAQAASAFVVDDVFEKETSPPYPHPLRGVEVVLRVRELSSQQVRQASVIGDFVGP